MSVFKVEMFVNGEDCALTSVDRSAGRRGLCGTMFIFKIAGAMAEAGKSLGEIVTTVKAVSANMGTMGLALGPCSLPGQGPLFSVDDDKLEIGLGVHGEAGVGSVDLCTAGEAVTKLLDHMTNPASATRIELKPGERLAVILNNLGGTSKLEELVLARELVSQLEGRGHRVVRVYTGHMMTSLEMAGILISLLVVSDQAAWLASLDASTEAPAWPRALMSSDGADRETPARIPLTRQLTEEKVRGAGLGEEGTRKVKLVLETLTADLLGLEERLNALDRGSGDGDCGSTLAAGARAVQASLSSLSLAFPLSLLQELAGLAENMGGSSGGLYSILLTTAATAFQDKEKLESRDWVEALRLGLEAVMKYGGARPGDRTMIDALCPALQRLEEAGAGLETDLAGTVRSAVEAAKSGAESTRTMKAQAGRASYVAADKVDTDTTPY